MRIFKKTGLLFTAILTALAIGCTAPAQTITSTMTQTATATVTTTQTTTATVTAVPVSLNISAASSLTDAIKEINTLYIQLKPYVTITPNFASSGTLQTQIENGAPCDIFVSAATAQMDNLQNKQLIVTDTRKNLLNNKIVLVVPTQSTLGITSFGDMALDKVKKIAIGDPKSVPAGNYAQQAFDLLGITAQVSPKYVMGSDVRGVLAYVESGNVDAGIVYSTDALTSTKVKVVASAPDTINAKVVYPVAAISATKVLNAAKEYISFLFSAQAKTIFEKYGFSMAIQ